MRLIRNLLLSLGMLLCAASSQTLGQTPDGTGTETLIQSLSNLDGQKMARLFEYLRIAPTPAFYECMCPAEYGYHPYLGPDGGPCRRIGPLGGVDFAGYAMERMQSCSAAYPLPDGRKVLDAIVLAASGPDAYSAGRAQVCAAITNGFAEKRAALEARLASGRRQLEIWEAQQRAYSDEVSKSFLRSALEAVFGSDWKPHPGPVLATVNQDIGAETCLQEVAHLCEQPVADDAPAASGGGKTSVLLGIVKSDVSGVLRSRAQQQWDLSLQRRAMLDSSPEDYRLATEANQMVGYADMCRAVADFVDARP